MSKITAYNVEAENPNRISVESYKDGRIKVSFDMSENHNLYIEMEQRDAVRLLEALKSQIEPEEEFEY